MPGEKGQQFSADDIAALVSLADEAGQAILRIYQQADLGLQLKDDQSPLTAADLAANAIICRGLTLRWPQIPILTEEGANPFQPGQRPALYWAIDPLDGTREFVKRNGEFTVNVALVEQGCPVFGLVFAPVIDALYIGIPGQGARRRRAGQWQDIVCAPASQALRVVCSRSHLSDATREWMAGLPQPVQTREIGSSLKFCLLAEGEADVYPRFGPTCIWDTAAGHGVLAAAGGRVLRADGGTLSYAEPGTVLNPDFVAWADAGSEERNVFP
jgi:3'(2'), 5'-bisphosphate nucleotidase